MYQESTVATVLHTTGSLVQNIPSPFSPCKLRNSLHFQNANLTMLPRLSNSHAKTSYGTVGVRHSVS